MVNYNFRGKRFSDDDIADRFYDEDWDWFRKFLGFTPKNHSDAERKFEVWKVKYYGRNI